MISRGTGVSLWRQIQKALTDDIQAAVIVPGERLPTEHDLAERFQVNRHTVRRAMKALEDDGLIRIEQGRGTFALEQVIDYPVTRRTRFSENLAAQHVLTGSNVRSVTRVLPHPSIAEALSIGTKTPCTVIQTLRDADGRPLSLADHYFPTERFPGIGEAMKDLGSISNALASFGISDYFRKVTRATARMPSREEAHLLDQPINRPLLVTESVNVDSDGRPLEYGFTRFAGDRVQLMFEP